MKRQLNNDINSVHGLNIRKVFKRLLLCVVLSLIHIYRDGETIWKKGHGVMTAPKFLKVGFLNGQVHIEAWLKYPILPGVYVGEMGTTGFFAAVPKASLKKDVDKLINQLCIPPVQQPVQA